MVYIGASQTNCGEGPVVLFGFFPVSGGLGPFMKYNENELLEQQCFLHV